MEDEEKIKKQQLEAQKLKQLEQNAALKQTSKVKGSIVVGKRESRLSGSTPASGARKSSVTPKFVIPPSPRSGADSKIQDFVENQELQNIRKRSQQVDQMEEESKRHPNRSQVDPIDPTLGRSGVLPNTARTNHAESKNNILSTTDAKKSDLSLAQRP